MEKSAANAMYDRLHKSRPYHDGTFTHWSDERSPDFPYSYRDGVTVWASPVDLNPEDDFLTNPKSVPGIVGTETVELDK